MDKGKLIIFFQIVIIELIVGIIYLFMYWHFAVAHIIFFGDLGLSNLNPPTLTQLFSISPSYTFILFSLIYHVSPSSLPIAWDYYLIFTSLLTPLGFYYLTYTLNLGQGSRMVSTVLYSLNPLTIFFNIGLEYVGIFLFFPIVLGSLIQYRKNRSLNNIIISSIVISLLFIFMGVDYLKFIVFIVAGIVISDIFIRSERTRKRKMLDYTIWLVLIAIISVPLLISLFSSLGVFSNSAAAGASDINFLVGTTKFEYSSSNFLVSLFAIPYVANPIVVTYENSWHGVLYLFIILSGLIAVLKYKGIHKNIYYILFIVLILLILFQFGVYNSSLIFLYYRISLMNLYNYPLFFYIMQMLIYSIFFSLFYETIEKFIKTRIKHFKSSHKKNGIMMLFVAIFIVIILVSEVPLIQYEHSQTSSLTQSNEVPDYVLNMVHNIKPYSNNRVLILPDNGTSMSYLDMGVSYYDIYGLPYGYQNFRSLFPNESRYLEIGQAFQNMNSSNVAKLVEAEDIGTIVVLNTGSNSTIKVSGTSINGGGATFSKVLNNTNVYNNILWNKNYAIYTFNASSLNHNYFFPSQNITYSEISNNRNISVVTSKYSYESYPFEISVNKSEKSLTYDQAISLNRSNINAINSNFSNIMFYYSNGTAIPAYIYNIENTTAHIYLKIAGEVNRTIDLRIYPYNRILFSSNGYIGEAPQLSGGGSPVLPGYAEYSVPVVGVYGYGYDGNQFTYNLTFNPSLFSKAENKNLSNLAIVSYNGTLLKGELRGHPTNTSTSATVGVSFPGGVPYFQKDKTTSDSYNVFYIVFANKTTNLNALHYNVANTSQPAINIGYLPYLTKDYGIYGEYDNGKSVFAYYTNYANSVKYASAWDFMLPVEGYGELVGLNTYGPSAHTSIDLTTIHTGEEVISYANMLGGQTASPLFLSNDTGVSLTGLSQPGYQYGGMNASQYALQNSAWEIGFGSNGTYPGVYLDYNNSGTYVEDILYNSNEAGFNYYGASMNGTELNFSINGDNIASYDSPYKTLNLGISQLNSGSMSMFYTAVVNEPLSNQMPAVKIGTPKVFQAYMLGKQLQNPVYSNTTVYFTGFYNNSLSGNIEWNMNNVTLYGYTVSYNFTTPGEYNITYVIDGLHRTIVENILPNPISTHYNLTLESGSHRISPELNPKNGIYEWYVNGIYAGNNRTLSYNFKYAGSYSISVYELNSYGLTSEHFSVTITKAHTVTVADAFIFGYNLVIPVILVAFIMSKKFRAKIYRYLEKISKKISHIF